MATSNHQKLDTLRDLQLDVEILLDTSDEKLKELAADLRDLILSVQGVDPDEPLNDHQMSAGFRERILHLAKQAPEHWLLTAVQTRMNMRLIGLEDELGLPDDEGTSAAEWIEN